MAGLGGVELPGPGESGHPRDGQPSSRDRDHTTGEGDRAGQRQVAKPAGQRDRGLSATAVVVACAA